MEHCQNRYNTGAKETVFQIKSNKKGTGNPFEKNPEFDEIASLLGVKDSEVAEMELRLGSRDVSLNEFIKEDGDNSHIDFLTYEGEDQESSLIKDEERSLIRRDIAGALAKLNERESYIILNRVMADDPQTLQEIGLKYNISRETGTPA